MEKPTALEFEKRPARLLFLPGNFTIPHWILRTVDRRVEIRG